MNEQPRFGLCDWITLVVILLVAAGARAYYVYKHADKANNSGPLLVQDDDHSKELEQLVTNLRENNDFKSDAPFSKEQELTSHTSPGYPLVLSLAARANQNKWQQWVRWGQCGLGGLTAALYFLFAFRAFRSRSVAILAGLLTAVHPFWIVNTAAINDGTLTAFALAWSLHLGARASEQERPLSALLFGLVLAGLSLVRATMLPFAFVAVIWFLWRCRRQDKGWLSAILAFLGFINGLVPWTIRNFKTSEAPVPIVDSTYYHLWMGNNPIADGGPAAEDELLTGLAIQTKRSSADWNKELRDTASQVERYRKLGKPTMDHITEKPGKVMQHRLEAGLGFVFGHKWIDQRKGNLRTIAEEPRPAPAWLKEYYKPILQGALYLMIGFGLVGLRWSFGWRDRSNPMALALFWIPIPYLLSHAENLHGPRMPLDGILLTFAAFALFCFVPSSRKQLFAGENAPESDAEEKQRDRF